MQVDTCCKECVFAVWDGITQTDCSLDRISMYSELGAVQECFDEEKEFYVIRNRICPCYRTQKWADRQKGSLKEQIEKELQISYHIILFSSSLINNVKGFLKTLLNQQVLPKILTIIRRPSDVGGADLVRLCQQLIGDKFAWTVRDIKNIELTETQLIDESVRTRQKNIPYYCVFYTDEGLPNNFFDELNNKILNEGFRFAMIMPEKGKHGLIVPYSIHQHLFGNYKKSILNKLRDEKCSDDLLVPFREVV